MSGPSHYGALLILLLFKTTVIAFFLKQAIILLHYDYMDAMNYIKKQKTIYAKEKLQDIIRAGSPDDQLLPEVALAKHLKVGEITVRRALKMLVDEGCIYRVRGSGTFISGKPRKNQEKKENKIISSNYFLLDDYGETEQTECVLRILLTEDKANLKVYDSLIDEFKKNHPHIDVEINTKPLKPQTISTRDMERNDIITVSPHQISLLAKEGFIQPLNDRLEGDPAISLEDINEHILKMMNYKDKVWMLPKAMNIFYLCYNKELFDKANLPYPDENTDWNSYLELAKKLTIKTNGSISQFGSVPFRNLNYLAPLIWSFGGDFTDESGKVSLTDPRTAKAIKYGIDLTMRHKTTQQPLHWNKDHLGQRDLFVSGKLAMHPSGNIGQLNLLKDSEYSKWGVAPLPKGPSGRFSPMSFYGWGISSESKHPEESFQLLKFLSSKKSISNFMQETNILPPLREVSFPDVIKNDESRRVSISTMLDSVRDFPFDSSAAPVFAKGFYEMLIDVYYKKKSLTQALKDAQKDIQNKVNDISKGER